MDKIVALAKRRGFIFPGSELYGGLANTYDYGPVGTELLRNIKNLWWETFVHRRTDIVGLDASLISHQKVWEASGHTSGFSDVLLDCKQCKHRIRADHLIEDYLAENEQKIDEFVRRFDLVPQSTDIDPERIKAGIIHKKVEGLTLLEIETILSHLKITCPNCGKFDWTTPRKFNLLFPVHLGIVMGDQSLAYLRGETAQGIFVNFENVVNSTRVRLPFGIAQLGKSFRNEVTLGNSVFRTIEFEQGEIEYFFDPESENWEKLFATWKEAMWRFIITGLGVREENLRWRIHTDEERSFYSKQTEDLEYKFPFGFKELWGLAYRTDYDLKQHIKHSGKELYVIDPKTNKKVIPHVIEPAVGINRLFLMALCDAYYEEGERTVLRLDPRLSPYKVAVFPLLSNKEQLVSKATEVFDMLRETLVCTFDDRGNIGKRYLYQDEIGTPWCVTIDFQTIEDGSVTVRDRDTTEQIRVPIPELPAHFQKKLSR
ncbi:MAG: glycine--tRNA ligase [bacterium]|nr:glycine--tRNA ligase [bacterium]